MLKVYALILVLGVLGGVGYGAKYYYDTTQATISTLRENNSRLEVAVQTQEDSINMMLEEAALNQERMNSLNAKLQKAEAYGDELRGKLSKIDLALEALKDAKSLEGKMNGATAKLWRGFMSDTGNVNEYPLPNWLQQVPTGTGDQSDNQDGKDNSTNSSETQATTAE